MSALFRALRAPLVVKLAGAHVVVLSGVVAALLWRWGDRLDGVTIALAGVCVAIAAGAHLALTLVALKPIRDLEEAAARVWAGNLEVRVSASPVADSGALRLGSTFNVLLDGLAAERARFRELTSEMIRIGDRDRATVARELVENTAQWLAALAMQLGAAQRETGDNPVLAAQLDELRAEAGDALEEVRALSDAVYPRVLDDLGLPAALQRLARVAVPSDVEIELVMPREAAVPAPVASALYHVAEQALRNAVEHAHARRVRIAFSMDADAATLELTDDGRGFDVPSAERRRPGMGLFTMRGRISLVGGRVEVASTAGAGTRILVRVPLHEGNHQNSCPPAGWRAAG